MLVRFLADENVHGDIVAWLRSLGQDVLCAADAMSGSSDERVLAVARDESRILITDDKDFGELVFRQHLAGHGIILIRLTVPSIQQRIQRLTALWPVVREHAEGKFIVISDRKIRIRPLATLL
jgi:predicted nuclease of predicted toxin-antitoxin system